jgi:hypothetical protein
VVEVYISSDLIQYLQEDDPDDNNIAMAFDAWVHNPLVKTSNSEEWNML